MPQKTRETNSNQNTANRKNGRNSVTRAQILFGTGEYQVIYPLLIFLSRHFWCRRVWRSIFRSLRIASKPGPKNTIYSYSLSPRTSAKRNPEVKSSNLTKSIVLIHNNLYSDQPHIPTTDTRACQKTEGEKPQTPIVQRNSEQTKEQLS